MLIMLFLIKCLMKESEEGSDSKIAVKVERKEDANNDDEDFDPSQYYRY